MSTTTGRVGVVVVAWGEEPQLVANLNVLLGAHPLPVVIVHNEGMDAPPFLGAAGVEHWRRPDNAGFAGAFNDGLARLDTEFVLSLTPDAVIEPKSLDRAMSVLEHAPDVGAVALRLVRPGGEVLDSAGIRLGFLRRGKDRGMDAPAAGHFLEPKDVDAACMAAALFRRSALEDARDGAGEVLDRRYVAYKEDVDLGWRLRRAGYRVRYEPSAMAIHVRGWRAGTRRSMPARIRRLSLRNRLLTLLKNESAPELILKSPLYLLREFAVALYLLLREPEILAAYRDVLREAPETLRRRPLAASIPRVGLCP